MEPNYHQITLTRASMEQKQAVSSGLLGNLLPDLDPRAAPTPLLFTDEWGKEYTFFLKVRPLDLNQARYDKKPEFMFQGWHAFVVEKKLKVGDRIFIWRDGHGDLRIRALQN